MINLMTQILYSLWVVVIYQSHRKFCSWWLRLELNKCIFHRFDFAMTLILRDFKLRSEQMVLCEYASNTFKPKKYFIHDNFASTTLHKNICVEGFTLVNWSTGNNTTVENSVLPFNRKIPVIFPFRSKSDCLYDLLAVDCL